MNLEEARKRRELQDLTVGLQRQELRNLRQENKRLEHEVERLQAHIEEMKKAKFYQDHKDDPEVWADV